MQVLKHLLHEGCRVLKLRNANVHYIPFDQNISLETLANNALYLVSLWIKGLIAVKADEFRNESTKCSKNGRELELVPKSRENWLSC